MEKFDRKKGADGLKVAKDLADSAKKKRVVNPAASWMQLGEPWMEWSQSSSGSDTNGELLMSVGVKDVSPAQVRALSRLGAKIENGEKLTFAVDKSEKVKKIIGNSFNEAAVAKIVTEANKSIVRQPGSKIASDDCGWEWGKTVCSKGGRLGTNIGRVGKNESCTWMKISGGCPWVKSIGKESLALVHKDTVSADQLKQLTELGATVTNSKEISIASSKLDEVKRILGEK